MDKVALGQVFSEYFGFPANVHSTKFSIIIITRGRYNRPFSGRRAEWTQFDSTSHYANLKKNYRPSQTLKFSIPALAGYTGLLTQHFGR
jgi:hypothetical protein